MYSVQESEFGPRLLKRSSGIPNSFVTRVDNINQPGVMMTGSGELVVPTIDAYVSFTATHTHTHTSSVFI